MKILIRFFIQVALSATKISASEDIQKLKPEDRNCFFPNETEELIIHKVYSQSNCLLECSLGYARKSLKTNLNLTKECAPWYFPSQEDNITICDPWETKKFLDFFYSVPGIVFTKLGVQFFSWYFQCF